MVQHTKWIFNRAATDLTGHLTEWISVVQHTKWILFTVFNRAATDLTESLTGRMIESLTGCVTAELTEDWTLGLGQIVVKDTEWIIIIQ